MDNTYSFSNYEMVEETLKSLDIPEKNEFPTSEDLKVF